MAHTKTVRIRSAHRGFPALELCAWAAMFGLGVWELVKSPNHLGGFGVWFQIAVAGMGVVASLWRLRTGER